MANRIAGILNARTMPKTISPSFRPNLVLLWQIAFFSLPLDLLLANRLANSAPRPLTGMSLLSVVLLCIAALTTRRRALLAKIKVLQQRAKVLRPFLERPLLRLLVVVVSLAGFYPLLIRFLATSQIAFIVLLIVSGVAALSKWRVLTGSTAQEGARSVTAYDLHLVGIIAGRVASLLGVAAISSPAFESLEHLAPILMLCSGVVLWDLKPQTPSL